MCCRHLREQKLDYIDHLIQAWGYSYQFAKGFVYSFIHGLYPDLFTTDATNLIRTMYMDVLAKSK